MTNEACGVFAAHKRLCNQEAKAAAAKVFDDLMAQYHPSAVFKIVNHLGRRWNQHHKAELVRFQIERAQHPSPPPFETSENHQGMWRSR